MKLSGHVCDVSVLDSRKTGEAEVNPFLSLHRIQVQNTYADGEVGAPYPYDAVLRRWLDAVTVILLARVDGETLVCLRSSVRPPLLLRDGCVTPVADERRPICLFELPAGLLEDDDKGESGILRRASIETLEETGYQVEESRFELMKCAPFVSPGVIPERIYYAIATIPDVVARGVPKGDGSEVEKGCIVEWVPLDKAIALCDDGTIEDMKTELGLRRVAGSM